jgi:serine/threonine-protein kinase RsbW
MINSNTAASLNDSELYTIQLPSMIESLLEVERFAEKIREQYVLEEDVFTSILICLNEAVSNAIVHGNRNDKNKTVFLNLEVVNAKRLIFTIADEGEGFRYKELPDPTAPDNIEKLTGRGVFIMKQLADQCVFNVRGNEVELHFKI